MSETRIKKILVYNPDPLVKERYLRLLGPTTASRFKFITGQEGTFQSALGQLNRDLETW